MLVASIRTLLFAGPDGDREGDCAHRNSPGVLAEFPQLWAAVSAVVGGCLW